MTDRELMQQALKELEYWDLHFNDNETPFPIITALRERLAQPVQDDGANTITFSRSALNGSVEMLRLSSKGFHYNGQVIEDAGEAHRLFMQWLAIANAEQPVQEPKLSWGVDFADGDGLLTVSVGRICADGSMELIHCEQIEIPVQEPVAHSIVAGALFDFMGWLTTRSERLVLSSTDDAVPAADAIKDFAQKRNLSINDAQVQEWQECLATPKPRKWQGLTKDQRKDFAFACGSYETVVAIEQVLREKNA